MSTQVTYATHVRIGSFAAKPSPVKIDLCLVWSKSGQTRAQLHCPLCANRRHRTLSFATKEAAIEPVYKRKFICSVEGEAVRFGCAPASPTSSRAMRILHYHCTTRALI